jgi:hypothetical protein
MFKTPILFIVFNRPDTVKQVFESIRSIKPEKLYIASDGPRSDKPDEDKLVEKVRAVIEEVDWPCSVHKLFRNENVGCKFAVSSAIDWFFETEEFGIIIEDDTLPNNNFYFFIEEMLRRYSDDRRIMMVTGTNYYSEPEAVDPYFYSEHMTIWGWGTWKRAWKLYDVEMKKWQNIKYKEFFKYKYFNSYWYRHYFYTFDSLEKGYMDTWDIQWNFCCLTNHGLCVTPSVNLVSNIGVFGTHGAGVTDSHFMKTYDIDLGSIKNLVNNNIIVNYEYDSRLHKSKSFKVVMVRDIVRFLKILHIYNIVSIFYKFYQRTKLKFT